MYTQHQLVQLRNVSIASVLADYNIQPARRAGHQLVYSSPLGTRLGKGGDSNPSLFVDPVDNTWKDFGLVRSHTGKTGGNVIDLVMEMGETDFEGAVRFLLPYLGTEQHMVPVATAKQKVELVDLVVKPLQHPSMFNYLLKRGIDANWLLNNNPALRPRLCQATYRNANEATVHTNVAWVNELGGIELKGPGRGEKTFTRCHGDKYWTLVPGMAGNKDRLLVFESFIDYLSLLVHYERATHQADVLVLNSTTQFQKSLPLVEQYGQLWLYLDHDNSGRDATSAYQALHSNVVDKSDLYAGYKDYNDALLDRPIQSKGSKTVRQAKAKAEDPTNAHRKDVARWWLVAWWVTPQTDRNGKVHDYIVYYCFDDEPNSGLKQLKQQRSKLAKQGLITYSRLCERRPGKKINGKPPYIVLEKKGHIGL